MDRNPRSLASGWKSYDACLKNADGENYWPFTDVLTSSGAGAASAYTKMRMVQDLGFATAQSNYKDSQGRSLVVKKDDLIWLLKCKPSCWRLYFYVTEGTPENRIIYVFAVCKKTDKEDPQSARKARNIADIVRHGEGGITPIEFPVRAGYETEAFKDAWSNDIRFHVSRNLLYLRRYRGMSQKALSAASGTSQSAIARIETGQENITLDTLQRLTEALNGRFSVSIPPNNLAVKTPAPWWEWSELPHNPDKVTGSLSWPIGEKVQAIVGFQRIEDQATNNRAPGLIRVDGSNNNVRSY